MNYNIKKFEIFLFKIIYKKTWKIINFNKFEWNQIKSYHGNEDGLQQPSHS